MKEKIIYHIDQDAVELKDPIMIVGLPGVGHVGKLVVDHLVEELKAEKIADLYSEHFPPQVHGKRGQHGGINRQSFVFGKNRKI